MAGQARFRRGGFGLLVGLPLVALSFALLGGAEKKAARAAALTAEGVAGYQTMDKLLITVGLTNAKKDELKGTLQIEILDKDGKAAAEASKEISQKQGAESYGFELPALKGSPKDFTFRCQFNNEKVESPLAKVLVVKAHETSVSAGQEFIAGSTASLRCSVHGVRSLSETVPLVGAEVEIRLKEKDKTTVLLKTTTDAEGLAVPQFKVPALPPGQYKLEIATKSHLGEEKLERDIRIKTDPKVLLVTDKPLYQPGQVIHIRALALQSYDMTPVANKDLAFEVEDSKGNKVFKKALKTSEFGVCSVDFQLADEVNMGDYHVRAVLSDAQQTTQADKTVAVKKYVLPKFKAEVKADKKFYLPKETISADLQADYFFGKPVADSKVKVTAKTFDVAFKDFQTWEGKTDANGHAKFEIKLPDYFVGQPLQKGNATVQLEVKLTDTADHSETINKTYPVSDQPIKVSLIPEGGRLVPAVENRVFAAAIYPDGSPASCDVSLWIGKEAKDKAFATIKTNEAGLAEFTITPKAEQLRQGQWGQRNFEMVGGQQQGWGPQILFDMTAQAKDAKGNTAKAVAEVNCEPLGENVLLRLDKAIYRGGDTLKVDIRSSAGLPTTYLDVVKAGQVLLTKWLDVKEGKAAYKLDLPASVFGTIEVHAYQMLGHGEIIRDSRVIYVQPPEGLKIKIEADKDIYQPGQPGKIVFQVSDAHGKPTAAALGVLIVDEAVYALQDMQPGLEKVYFTLQEELLKPQAQAVYKPSETVDVLIQQPMLALEKQQIAQCLLAPVRCKAPARWEVAPAVNRRQNAENQIQQLGWGVFNYAAQNNDFQVYDDKAKEWKFKAGLLEVLVKAQQINPAMAKDPFGQSWTMEDVAKLEKKFTAENLAKGVTHNRMQTVLWTLVNYSNIPAHKAQLFKDNKWTFTAATLAEALKSQKLDEKFAKDAWGRPIRLMKKDKKWDHQTGWTQYDFHQLVSAGPDGKFKTDDDVAQLPAQQAHLATWWWADDATRLAQQGHGLGRGDFNGFRRQNRAMMLMDGAMPMLAGAAPGGAGFGGGRPEEAKADFGVALPKAAGADPGKPGTTTSTGPAGGANQAPVRVREYFPETMLWQPNIITDDQGRAEMPLQFADSITTWRMTASASSRHGLLGGVDTPLRVFQDFFVDLDLPVALTQNDEVAFPVAVYNYLKTPQTVKLDLQQEAWFDLVDGAGYTRSLDLKPNEVTAVKFRIKARKIGYQPLTVKAVGTKLSDAIKRTIEVVPDGQKIETVMTDRLQGRVSQTIEIPQLAIPDSYKLMVKIYPGVFSQVMEGGEGMLRMPGGCFEQTSSSAYPNILVVDYMKKAKVSSPEILMKAETYLNAGYQRLLTFERPGGGFDWWGSGEPLVWLSAYGLQEFSDMAKVWPIDKGIITRTQAWLMKQRDKDGTWSNIGATHGETIANMGDPKMLLTSYVTWALIDSGMKDKEIEKSVDYIRKHIADARDNAYILALAANALAAWDPKDDHVIDVLNKLDKLQKDMPEIKACCFPVNGQSLTYARGDMVTVESTALTAMAMMKTGQFTNSVNKALTYLLKSKQAGGTWGSTQSTILSLKALLAGMGGTKQAGKAPFKIMVNGKEAAKGEVNEDNSDVLQFFDLKDNTAVGRNDVEIVVDGNTNLMYQIVGRYFEPWKQTEPKEPMFSVAVDYDRTKLSTNDLLRAKATLKYHGKMPTYMVIVDLGIPPGFTADAGDFAEMAGKKKIQKFSLTSRQVILYIGDVKQGDVMTFEYGLKPKYPIKAKTPATVAYEYNAPVNLATAKPVEITVAEKKE